MSDLERREKIANDMIPLMDYSLSEPDRLRIADFVLQWKTTEIKALRKVTDAAVALMHTLATHMPDRAKSGVIPLSDLTTEVHNLSSALDAYQHEVAP